MLHSIVRRILSATSIAPVSGSLVLISTAMLMGQSAFALEPAEACEIMSTATFHAPFDRLNTDGSLTDSLSGRTVQTNNVSIRSGYKSGAAVFNANSRAVIEPIAPVSGDEFTISLWVRPDDLSRLDMRFLSQTSGPERNQHILSIGTISNQFRFLLKTGPRTWMVLTGLGSGLTEQGVWTHLAFVYGSKRMSVWKNGERLASQWQDGNVVEIPEVTTTIGNQPVGAGDFPFIGAIDELTIFSNELNAEEIRFLASGARCVDAADANQKRPIVLHVMGQSNALGTVLPGTAPVSYKNKLGMVDETGALVPDGSRLSRYGLSAVAANNWPSGTQLTLAKTVRSGVPIDVYNRNWWPKHKVKLRRLDPDAQHVVVWIQGEAEAAGIYPYEYIDESRKLFDAIERSIPGVLILDVLLNENQIFGGPTDRRNRRAKNHVNAAKKQIAAERRNVRVIGGNYDLRPDNVHYNARGFEQMSAEVWRNINIR